LLTGNAEHQDLRDEAGDIAGPQINGGDDQTPDQLLRTVKGSELRAGGLLSQRAKIYPQLIRRLARSLVELGPNDPADPEIEYLEGSEWVH
jgi:hypothetical protein